MADTPRVALPYPLGTDAPNINADLQALAQRIESLLHAVFTTVERDALAGDDLYIGRIIYNTTTSRFEWWDGDSWERWTNVGDADTVDGQHAAAFALSGHTHSGGVSIVYGSYTGNETTGRFISTGSTCRAAIVGGSNGYNDISWAVQGRRTFVWGGSGITWAAPDASTFNPSNGFYVGATGSQKYGNMNGEAYNYAAFLV